MAPDVLVKSIMRLVPYVGLISLLGCSSGGGVAPGGTIRRPATIEFSSHVADFIVPATAQPNVPFSVSFTTYRGGCDSRSQNDVLTSTMTTEIRSYENERVDEGCLDFLAADVNSVTLTFLAAGTGHVILYGRKDPGSTPLVIDRSVTVAASP